MIAKYLWQTGSVILVILGSTHLYYTFFTDKFSSLNGKVIEEMKASSPILTQELTMWKAWIGFNGSHSSGVVFIGLINYYLAHRYFAFLQSDHYFFLFTMLTVSFYVWLAKEYWFAVPFIGVSTTLICFAVSYILTVMNK